MGKHLTHALKGIVSNFTVVIAVLALVAAPTFSVFVGNASANGSSPAEFDWTRRSAYTPGYNEWSGAPAVSTNGNRIAMVSNNYNNNVSPYGQLWTSADAGASWTKHANTEQYRLYNIGGDGTGQYLVAAGREDDFSSRIYTSNDYGATWTDRDALLYGVESYVWGIVASTDGSRWYMSVWNQDEEEDTTLVSANNGATWTPLAVPQNDNGFAIASSANGAVLAGIALRCDAGCDDYQYDISEIYISDDYGANWTSVGPAEEEIDEWINIAISADGATLAITANDDFGSGLVYISTNSGDSWELQEDLGSAYWWTLAMSANGQKIAVESDSGTFVTTNGGAAWSELENFTEWGLVYARDGSKLFTWDGEYFYRSTDDGDNRTESARFTGYQRFVDLTMTGDGQRLLAVSDDDGVFRSTNYGATWTQLEGSEGLEFSKIAYAATGAVVVATDDEEGVYLSTDHGTNWSLVPDLDFEYNTGIAVSSDGSKIVLVSGYGEVARSDDSGETWSTLNIENEPALMDVAVSADGSRAVAVSTGSLVYVSSNYGEDWEAIELADSGWGAVASSASGEKVYITSAGGQVYTSTNYGTDWQVLDEEGEFNDIATSAAGNRVLAVGYNNLIRVSNDAGATWTTSTLTNPEAASWGVGLLSSDGARAAIMAEDYAFADIWTGTASPEGEGNSDPSALTSAEDGSKITLSQVGCDTIASSETKKESGLQVQDSGYSYPVGFVGFTLDGCGTGGDATITVIFTGSFDPVQMLARKHNTDTGSFMTVSNAVMTKTTLDGKEALEVTYVITDGGELDQDGTANGQIVDPVGLGTRAVGAPNTGLGTRAVGAPNTGLGTAVSN